MAREKAYNRGHREGIAGTRNDRVRVYQSDRAECLFFHPGLIVTSPNDFKVA